MNEILEYSKDGLHLTEQFEGCCLVAYQDRGGVWTIGYGHTRGVYPGMTCTQGQADAWLQQDIQVAVAIVKHFVRVKLTQHEFDALVDFEFNTGHLPGSTLLALLNKGKYDVAAQQFENWKFCKGQVVAGLLRRRVAEHTLFAMN